MATAGVASPALVAVLASLGAACVTVGVVVAVTSSAWAIPPAKKKAAMTALASP